MEGGTVYVVVCVYLIYVYIRTLYIVDMYSIDSIYKWSWETYYQGCTCT